MLFSTQGISSATKQILIWKNKILIPRVMITLKDLRGPLMKNHYICQIGKHNTYFRQMRTIIDKNLAKRLLQIGLSYQHKRRTSTSNSVTSSSTCFRTRSISYRRLTRRQRVMIKRQIVKYRICKPLINWQKNQLSIARSKLILALLQGSFWRTVKSRFSQKILWRMKSILTSTVRRQFLNL